ncbi:EAL domain-containing protein [Thalassotalea sp. G20_0]|uniref:sensor domain-containing phosphodiesterase n=1 Tax=Thalassotalea sp. G20_0 TaxID=2821093 RepID=UPI001ADC8312|nr:EAL domain-containing protein [Thalassotalea sp. G20_0]MBO9493778.1 EAL domain-containing protein [Thalassotalea sp. G20_0]
MALGDNDLIRFLIIDSSTREAESLLNVFRESGYSTRAKQINSLDDLTEATSGQQHWDLLLMAEPPEPLTYSRIFDDINQKGIDLPGIVLINPDDETDELSLIQMGARAVIPTGHDEYLLTVARKEFEDLKVRRHHRRMSVALHESEKQRQLLLDDQVDAVVYINYGRIRFANTAFINLLGLAEEESQDGKLFRDLIITKDQQDVEAFLMGIEESGQALAAIQCPLVAHNGSEVPVSIVISPTSFNGEFTLSLQIKPCEKEGEQDEVDKTLEKSAPDAETGLFDRKLFDQALDIAIQRAVEGKGKSTLCYLHLETLKAAHEQHGKEVSQKLFKSVAQKITSHLDATHHVSSRGGANFAALLREGEEQDVTELMESLLAAVTGEDIVIDQHSLPVKLSIGAVILSDTVSDAETLTGQSRQATVLAQKQGGNQLCFYQKRKASSVHSVEKQLAGMVSQAIKNKTFRLSYQPVISLAGSPSEYYEVSFVLTDPEGKEHEASEFRPKLEKISLWNKLDRWQLIEASKALMAKRKEGSDTRLLLHVGGCSATDDTFIPWMKVALKTAGIPTDAVAIELSEQNLARYSEVIPDFFSTLKAMGCQTVISEFGCSLNPLEGIAHLDIDLVKLDQSFTEDLSSGGNAQELQKMIQDLSQSGRKVIVPGIETAEEMTPVWQYGADFIQGSYMQPPSERMDFDFGADG